MKPQGRMSGQGRPKIPAYHFLTYPKICRKGGGVKIIAEWRRRAGRADRTPKIPANSFLTYPMICRKGEGVKIIAEWSRRAGRADRTSARVAATLGACLRRPEQPGGGVRVTRGSGQ
ncbi:hypothetical protein CYR34_20265 [Chimaeribacter arupi]|uniref:Uncharacterized protein n=1 Tax=Chimaeribacter arupi TaxID=2060066 RepID=A0A2N5EHS3_9GAMM|nr:hypothetical protein CYR34_20265 [Chimaeribacter arupi]